MYPFKRIAMWACACVVSLYLLLPSSLLLAASLNVGTFNLMRFGNLTNKDLPRIISLIKEADYDVFAGIEILSEAGATTLLRELRKHDAKDWQVILSPSSNGESTYKEYFAVYYRSSVVSPEENHGGNFCSQEKLAAEERESSCFIADPNGVFERDPFVVHLMSGHASLTIVAVHLYYGKNNSESIAKRHAEVETLHGAMQAMRRLRPRAHVMAAGDFNLELPDESQRQIQMPDHLFQGRSGLTGLISDATTIGRSSYDHILFFAESSLKLHGNGERVIMDFNPENDEEKRQYHRTVSDHFPVVVTLGGF